jgi:hypothetical protein
MTDWRQQVVNVAQFLTIIIFAVFASPILSLLSDWLIYNINRYWHLNVATPGQFIMGKHGQHDLSRQDVIPASLIDIAIWFVLILLTVFWIGPMLKKRKAEA